MGNEWALVFFTAFVGLGSGTFVAVGVSEWWEEDAQVRLRGGILALIALAAGGFSSVLHLGHPERIFGALGHPTSGIFMEALMIGLTGLCAVAYLIALRRGASGQVRKRIAVIGAVPAILLAFAVGDTYVMASRPAWDTLLLPMVYLISAALLGCLSLGVLMARQQKAEAVVALKWTTLGVLALQGVVVIAYLVAVAVAPYPNATRSVIRVLTGNLAPLFWGGVVLVGLLVPSSLTIAKRAAAPLPVAAATFALVCAFVGAASFRLLMFNLGTSVWHFF
ncbi:DmsC/YnfH family molybdoenzyme membrane anchor subunit [Telmatospirillum sp.]|uniref:dimethyl sulfoxide reductase anchor subunit family protein n=1 Tax=Telmatospirillum sp. TaxID=2079197 RepID=UPI0028521EAC|nr:DmsC/YnfH family molybdoenzyme membrane anchor subunit [Telmatospirillum sp.]MDR3437921.1 dimethyl sulfoxide reductase anchor subunit [Telmatospirillum sp.]